MGGLQEQRAGAQALCEQHVDGHGRRRFTGNKTRLRESQTGC